MIGLTSLWTSQMPDQPNLDRRRALIVLDKIDEILAWEKTKDQERDVRFVELGQYLCEVRAKQYWRLEQLKSFDEFLEKRFPESRRKAYYLMAIHETLTTIPKPKLREIGWRKAAEMVRSPVATENSSIVHPGCTKRRNFPRTNSSKRSSDILRGKKANRGS